MASGGGGTLGAQALCAVQRTLPLSPAGAAFGAGDKHLPAILLQFFARGDKQFVHTALFRLVALGKHRSKVCACLRKVRLLERGDIVGHNLVSTYTH